MGVDEYFDHWQDLVSNPSCVCRGGFVSVQSINKTPFLHGSAPAIGGLSHSDTAILAGVLTGLATFLFLALPILCCLCPLPCACCGGGGGAGKKKTAGAIGAAKARQLETISARSTDVESINSYRSFNKEWDKLDKFDYDNLYEVDMKLPRVWLESLRGVPQDQLDGKLRELESGWEGQDIRKSDLEASHEMYRVEDAYSTVDRSGGGYNTGGSGGGYANAAYRMESSGDLGGGVTEIERTRQINIEGTMSQLPEAEYIYEREFRQEMDGLDKDNFMKIYCTYRRLLDDSKQTAF